MRNERMRTRWVSEVSMLSLPRIQLAPFILTQGGMGQSTAARGGSIIAGQPPSASFLYLPSSCRRLDRDGPPVGLPAAAH